MDLVDIQRFAVERINADPVLSAAGCIAVVEDKGDAFAEVNSAVEGGLCAIVLLPKWSPRSSAAKNAVGNADLVVNLTEIPDLNRERPNALHGLTAAQRIAWLLNMEKVLHERVVGQDEAVTSIAKAIRRGRVGLKDPKRPVGSFIFLGPTGVGKTELCKALAQAMFGDENAMLRLDMSEYMEKHTVSKLIGSPPGYVGFDEGGQLTEKVRRKPYSVVLFDEIEKAHPDVFNMLLQILEDGRLTDSQGRTVDFKNTVIIMTSNVGARLITEHQNALGFVQNEEKEEKDTKSLVLAELKKVFRPEFLNRVDDIIVFNKLTQDEIKEIASKMLDTLSQRLKAMDITITFTDAAVTAIADKGFDDAYGARPLRRAIQSEIEDTLSEYILDGKVQANQKVVCDFADGGFDFKTE